MVRIRGIVHRYDIPWGSDPIDSGVKAVGGLVAGEGVGAGGATGATNDTVEVPKISTLPLSFALLPTKLM
jgi:hypothetical protein